MKTALKFALLSFLIAVPAHANGIESGTLMVCDTKEQIERVGQLFAGNGQAAISAVNTEERNPTACGIADLAYVEGKPIATVRNKSHTFHVIPVIVVGVNTPGGFQPVDSAVLFTLVQ